MSKIEIDRVDTEIIRLLQEDAELSAAAVGERIGLSQSPCWRRIQRLRQEGLIQGQFIRVHFATRKSRNSMRVSMIHESEIMDHALVNFVVLPLWNARPGQQNDLRRPAAFAA